MRLEILDDWGSLIGSVETQGEQFVLNAGWFQNTDIIDVPVQREGKPTHLMFYKRRTAHKGGTVECGHVQRGWTMRFSRGNLSYEA